LGLLTQNDGPNDKGIAMKAVLAVAAATLSVSMLTSCGASGDNPEDRVITTETGLTIGGGGADPTDSGGALNPTLLNGRTRIDLGTLTLNEEKTRPINYNSRIVQFLFEAADPDAGVLCLATLAIANEDVGINTSYTNFIQREEADGAETVVVTDIAGPTNNVGIEYIYSTNFTAEDGTLIVFTSIVRAHYLSAQDVTFGNPALSTTQCATFTDRYGQNEAQMRAILDSIEYLRGTEGEADLDGNYQGVE